MVFNEVCLLNYSLILLILCVIAPQLFRFNLLTELLNSMAILFLSISSKCMKVRRMISVSKQVSLYNTSISNGLFSLVRWWLSNCFQLGLLLISHSWTWKAGMSKVDFTMWMFLGNFSLLTKDSSAFFVILYACFQMSYSWSDITFPLKWMKIYRSTMAPRIPHLKLLSRWVIFKVSRLRL